MTQGFVQVATDGSGKKMDNDVVPFPPGSVDTDGSGNQTTLAATDYRFRERVVLADPNNPVAVATVTGAAGPNVGDFGSTVRLAPGQADLQTVTAFLQSIDTNIQNFVFAFLGALNSAQNIIPAAGSLGPAQVSPTVPRSAIGDIFGRQIVIPHTIRDLCTPVSLTITASTSETNLLAATDANVFNDLVAIIVTNTSTTLTEVDIRDATAGTLVMAFEVPANDTRGLSLGGVIIPQSKAGQNWTVQCGTSVTSVKIWALFAKNRNQ